MDERERQHQNMKGFCFEITSWTPHIMQQNLAAPGVAKHDSILRRKAIIILIAQKAEYYSPNTVA